MVLTAFAASWTSLLRVPRPLKDATRTPNVCTLLPPLGAPPTITIIPTPTRISVLVRTMASSASSPAEPPSYPAGVAKPVEYKGKNYTGVTEGLATILAPGKTGSTVAKHQDGSEVQQVFYNPIQQFNRDLTVLAIKAYADDALAAKREKEHKQDKSNKRKNRPRQGKKHVNEDSDERPHKQPKIEGENGDTKGEATEGRDVNDDDPMEAKLSPADPSTLPPALPPADVDEDGKDAPDSSTTGEVKMPIVNATKETAQKKDQAQSAFTILDALSASGLRALRYAQELPFVTSVTANDMMASAVDTIKLNAEYNNVEHKIRPNRGDAKAHMYSVVAEHLDHIALNDPRGMEKDTRYDVVDIDPYGSPAPFLDAAIQCIRDDGGLLCITCTDSPIFAGTGYPEKTFAVYGGVPIKGPHSHEVGLRLVLHSIATTAARYGLAVEPLLSLSVDYYLRFFIRVRKSPASVKFLSAKSMVVYTCDMGCGSWTTQHLAKNKVAPHKKKSGVFYKHGFALGPGTDQHCEHCGSKMHIGGPMYGGRLHSQEFIQKILDDIPNVSKEQYGTVTRLEGMLVTALEEAIVLPALGDDLPPEKDVAEDDPHPFYVFPSALARMLHCQTPQEDALRGAFCHLGYKVTRSHCKPGSLKTNAPWKVIWHIMREYVRQKSPVTVENIKTTSAAYKILRLGKSVGTSPATDDEEEFPEVVFDEKLGKQSRQSSGGKVVRYPPNPSKNWGPMNKAQGS